MDCDYDPKTETENELIENTKGRKKRKRKSLFAKAVSQPKPVFDPHDKSYEEYLDEYYKLDCEDIIGDIPCRFKYRKVLPNDFGLSIEEILTANDRELNKWCSLKKALQHRPEEMEKYDQIAYKKKANDLALKRRILPSLFKTEENEDEKQEDSNKKTKRKKVRCKKGVISVETKSENITVETVVEKKTDINSENTDISPQKKKKKMMQVVTKVEERVSNVSENPEQNTEKKKKKKRRKSKKVENNNDTNIEHKQTQVQNNKRKMSNSGDSVLNKKPRKDFKNKNKKQNIGISDSRLSAYGINPKKFKNKLKYGKS